MTYFWREGYPITVITQHDGSPQRITWDWYTDTGDVWMIGDVWSVDDRWWAKREQRRYYKVATETGHALIIFQDLLTLNWYIQWAYD